MDRIIECPWKLEILLKTVRDHINQINHSSDKRFRIWKSYSGSGVAIRRSPPIYALGWKAFKVHASGLFRIPNSALRT